MGGPTDRQLVAVKSITGCGVDDWREDRLLPGDVIDQIRVVKKIMLIVSAPFAGGKSALQRELRKVHQAGESALLKVKRGGAKVDLQASVVAEEPMMRKKIYLLADIVQKNYVAYLMDATEDECLALQDQTRKVMEKVSSKSPVLQAPLKDRLISYPWQAKMEQFLPSPTSAMVFSLILMPFQSSSAEEHGPVDGNLEDTTARAMAWLSASQSSGVPIIFVNIQCEPLFLQSSTSKYFGSGGTEDPLELVNSGMYALHELEGTEINVTRAIRLWYSPPEGELAVTLRPKENEPRLGVNITCTEEGFCYVSSVDGGTAADRAGVRKIYDAACSANKLLVVSRVAGEKVTPWFVSSSGSIRCFNAHSISERISAHRQAREAIEFYFMVWSGATSIKTGSSRATELERLQSEAQAARYSLSTESEKFDSSGSGQSLAADTLGQTAAAIGAWKLALSEDDQAVHRSSSTRSFSFHEDSSSSRERSESTTTTTTTSEDFTFTTGGE